MTNQITIEKTDWAGKQMFIICRDGEQVTQKMYQTREAAEQATSIPSLNAYVERIEKHAAKYGKESAIERGRKMVGSWVLGREFGETSESFFARNPLMAEFIAWFNGFEVIS